MGAQQEIPEPEPAGTSAASRAGARTFVRVRALKSWLQLRDFFGGRDAKMLVLAALVGMVTGVGALGFRALVDGATHLCFGGESVLRQAEHLPWPYRLGIPVVGLSAAWALTRWLAKEAKGHGVPEVMEAVSRSGSRIRGRVLIVKSLASAITIGTGGSVGREGPIVQIGSALGSTVGRLLGLDEQRVRTLVACGAAAGIAATFNAPMAGVIFAVEIILGSATVQTFSPIVVSAVVATALSRAVLGSEATFVVPAYSLESPWELIAYIVLGVAAGLVAATFIRILYRTEDLFEMLPFPFLAPLVGGLLVGAIGLLAPGVYGLGYETIELALHGQVALGTLAFLVIAKLLATSVTLGGGGSGGVFAPSLFLGATLGGAVGIVTNQVAPWLTVQPAAYALVGMGAVVAGTTHAPLTAIIIIFELTGDYEIILPLMLASIISSVVCVALQRESIYTLKLLRRGIRIGASHQLSTLLARPAQDLLSSATSVLGPRVPFDEIVEHVLQRQGAYHYVVDGEGRLLGVIALEDIKGFINDEGLPLIANAFDVMTPPWHAIGHDDSIERCLEHFSGVASDELPMIDREKKLIGVIKRKDILALYNQELLSTNDLGLLFVTHEGAADKHDYVELAAGQVVASVPVPATFVGKTLRELDIRAQHGCLVVGVRERDDTGVICTAPDPDKPMGEGSVLVVEGPEAGIQWLRDQK